MHSQYNTVDSKFLHINPTKAITKLDIGGINLLYKQIGKLKRSFGNVLKKNKYVSDFIDFYDPVDPYDEI